MDKYTILDNIQQYDAPKLVEYIRQGVVTYEEMCCEQDFSVKIRKEVKDLLDGNERQMWEQAKNSNSSDLIKNFIDTFPNSIHRTEAATLLNNALYADQHAAEVAAWNNVDKNSIDSLQVFVCNYPDSSYTPEARSLIDELQKEGYLGYDAEMLLEEIAAISTDYSVVNKEDKIYNRICYYLEKRYIQKEELVGMLREDHNLLQPGVVKLLLDKGQLSYGDIDAMGIHKDFVKVLLKGLERQKFMMATPIDRINKVSTEIYFWGIPSSGKSCALGAILSVASNGKVAETMIKDNDCQGYGYMNSLMELFTANGNVAMLPAGTATCNTYEMGFDLVDKEGLIHPITCIDLAGELMRCMCLNDEGSLSDQDEMAALDTLTSIVHDNRTGNRKIHFFVLEYGAENKTYKGRGQQSLLSAALRYIERTQVFNKDTDAIYLMISKADKVKGNQREVLARFIHDTYCGFYKGLKQICKQNEINNGEVPIVPFSLGEVCFQDYCRFNDKAASNVVDLLLKKTKGYKTGKFNEFLRGFKK